MYIENKTLSHVCDSMSGTIGILPIEPKIVWSQNTARGSMAQIPKMDTKCYGAARVPAAPWAPASKTNTWSQR